MRKAAWTLLVVGGAWVALCGLLFICLVGAAFLNLIAGKPSDEGIVMAPEAFVLLSVCAFPGVFLTGLGFLLLRRVSPRER
jgi:hypothetical protein